MPSGVSHGSSLPAGAAVVALAKATSAKFGMRLMASTISSIMIRMLMADDRRHLLRPVILLRGLARQVGDSADPTEPGFSSVLPRWHHVVGAVARDGHDLDPLAVDAAKTQRRAAGGAIAALGDRGGAEERRLSLGPGKVRLVDVGEGGERRAA